MKGRRKVSPVPAAGHFRGDKAKSKRQEELGGMPRMRARIINK